MLEPFLAYHGHIRLGGITSLYSVPYPYRPFDRVRGTTRPEFSISTRRTITLLYDKG